MFAAKQIFLGRSAKAAAPTARSYVQDGLIWQIDGIENAGYGVHDAAAATWKDLKGSDDLTVTSSGVWSDDGIDNFATAYRIAYRSSFTFDAPLTQEVVFHFKGVPADGQINNVMLHISQWHSGNSMVRGIHNIRNVFKLKTATTGYAFARVFNPVSVASTYDSGGVVSAYKDGESIAFQDMNDNWYYNDATGVNLGNRSGNNRGCYIKFYAIRFYNRVLTENELAANYAIDKERFNLP